jgi:hypothetical protein
LEEINIIGNKKKHSTNQETYIDMQEYRYNEIERTK